MLSRCERDKGGKLKRKVGKISFKLRKELFACPLLSYRHLGKRWWGTCKVFHRSCLIWWGGIPRFHRMRKAGKYRCDKMKEVSSSPNTVDDPALSCLSMLEVVLFLLSWLCPDGMKAANDSKAFKPQKDCKRTPHDSGIAAKASLSKYCEGRIQSVVFASVC